MKLMKTIQAVAFLVFYIYAFIVCLSQSVTTDTAWTLILIGKIIVGFILFYNLLILVVRLIELFNDASSTYGENAKPIPNQKIKSRLLTTTATKSK